MTIKQKGEVEVGFFVADFQLTEMLAILKSSKKKAGWFVASGVLSNNRKYVAASLTGETRLD